MGLETFPEIENFQKLPRQVIVKGGRVSIRAAREADLAGIVINNSGQPIRDVRVFVVLLDKDRMPILNHSVPAVPDRLSQGSMGSFNFSIKDSPGEITDYHLYTNWRFDEGD